MNNKVTFITLLLAVVATVVSAQNKTGKVAAAKPDTLKFYLVNLVSMSVGATEDFRVNGKIVPKGTYEKYFSAYQNLKLCKPCYLSVYDDQDTLMRISFQYTDCPVGSWTEFYPDGTVKVKGQYVENNTGNWDKLVERGFCTKTGVWQYYDGTGKLIDTKQFGTGNP